MNEIPAEVQEFVKMLQSKAAIKEFLNELVEMQEQEEKEQEQEQDSIQDLPFELALMGVKTHRNTKRKHWANKVLVDVNGFVYMQDTVGGNLVKYEATFEDINAKDWIVYG